MGAHLIAIDWGTTNLRATRLDATGRSLEVRSAAAGVLQVQDSAFEEALLALCGDWLQQGQCALIASGMIGSRQGWREAAYLHTPAGPEQAAAALLPVEMSSGQSLWIIPGVHHRHEDGVDDVMRGEETQIWGGDFGDGSMVVLPGTHSKWAGVDSTGRISGFRTWMTGELYSVLLQHSILGRLAKEGESSESFALGVQRGLGQPGDLTALLFSVRTAGLMGRLDADCLPDYLSGLLIGAELASGMSLLPNTRKIELIGEPALCARYARAAELAGLTSRNAPPGLAARGAFKVARLAGLV